MIRELLHCKDFYYEIIKNKEWIQGGLSIIGTKALFDEMETGAVFAENPEAEGIIIRVRAHVDSLLGK